MRKTIQNEMQGPMDISSPEAQQNHVLSHKENHGSASTSAAIQGRGVEDQSRNSADRRLGQKTISRPIPGSYPGSLREMPPSLRQPGRRQCGANPLELCRLLLHWGRHLYKYQEF